MEKINSILDPRGQELLHTAVTLDLGKTKEILDKYLFTEDDFNKMKTVNQQGFLLTFLRRFSNKEIIDQTVELKDVIDMVKLLIQYGLKINQETETAQGEANIGNALTTEIARSNYLKNTDLIQVLLENGSDFDYEDKEGNIPLFYMPYYNASVKLLKLTQKAHHLNKHKENALFFQIRNVRVLKLLYEYGLDHEVINEYGDSLLLHCARYGTPECLDYLLKKGHDGYFVNEKTGESALFVTKLKKNLDILLNHGFDIHAINGKGETLLFTSNKKMSIVKVLLQSGLNVNHQDNEGNTVLHKVENEHLLEILAQNGFDFSIKNNMGETVLEVYRRKGAETLYGKTRDSILLIEDLMKKYPPKH